MRSHITDEDEGKQVIRDNETIGRVAEVDRGTAYVDPDPGVAETVKSKLGWADADADSFALDENSVREVTDDEVRIDVEM